MAVMIKKASGDLEEFNSEKVKRAILRSGASEDVVLSIERELEEHLYEGISTREIFGIVHRLLRRERPIFASRYDLKGAIMRLGPDGFTFENYVARLLEEYGYKTWLRQHISGGCVVHEIDIVAESPEGVRSAIECKYHNSKGISTGIKVAMYTFMRLLDLRDGCKNGSCENFDDIWLITNTRFSDDAIHFAECKELRLLGWRYPSEKTLESMIESKSLYPITILRSVDKKTKKIFFRENLLFAKDLVSVDFETLQRRTMLSRNKLRLMVSEAEHFFDEHRDSMSIS